MPWGNRPRRIDDPLDAVVMGWAVTPELGACWIWARAIDKSNGYGVMGTRAQFSGSRLAHRVSYELHVGPVPDGLQLDHLCRTRACVRYDHLEPVTNQVNGLRGISPAADHARKTVCPRCGGPYDVTWRNGPNRSSCRRCTACRNEYKRDLYHAQKGTP